ncbi:MAG: hypothetical protein J6X18_07365 [Bacteroidales bacterium]|nr:hypothetical protein [Bacteroidales bacterium]
MNNKEIIEASIEYQMSKNPMCIGGDVFAEEARMMNINTSFIAGAEWMKERLIEEAATWWKDYLSSPIEFGCRLETIIGTFKQYMKGG